MSMAERNRAIKRTLESAFGRGKVRVRGARGTAYGYVDVKIDCTPLDADQSGRMKAECKRLLRAAGIDLGHSYTNDTCQWESDQCLIGFNQCRYFRAMRLSDGTLAVMADRYDAEWQSA
jgi:hypothetical protein